MSDDEKKKPEEPFSENVKDLMDEFVKDHGEPAVAVLMLVGGGRFMNQVLVYADRPDVYQAIGLLEQAKAELLQTIPENQPHNDDDIELEFDLFQAPAPDKPS